MYIGLLNMRSQKVMVKVKMFKKERFPQLPLFSTLSFKCLTLKVLGNIFHNICINQVNVAKLWMKIKYKENIK